MSTTVVDDHYVILQVSTTATAEAITKSYRKLAKQLHPDKNKAANATEQFQKLNHAHDILKDPELRCKYDRSRPAQSAESTPQDKNPEHTSKAKTQESASKAKAPTGEELKYAQQRESLIQRRDKQASLVEENKRAVKQFAQDIILLEIQLSKIKSTCTLKQDEPSLQWQRSQKINAIQTTRDLLLAARNNLKRQQVALDDLEVQVQRLSEEEEQRRADGARHQQYEEHEHIWAARRERARKMYEAEQRQREEEIRKAAEKEQARCQARRAEEAAALKKKLQKARRRAEQKHKLAAKTCEHPPQWAKIEGGQRCPRCDKLQHKFILKCPACNITACGNCRKSIRNVV